MAASIYSKNRNYYIKEKNGDITECKLVSVRLAFHDVKLKDYITANGEKDGVYLDQIVLYANYSYEEEEDDEINEYETEYHYFWQDGNNKHNNFNPLNVYSTEANAINGVSPLFVRKGYRICLNQEVPFPKSPKKTFWNKNKGLFSKRYNLASYFLKGYYDFELRNVKFYEHSSNKDYEMKYDANEGYWVYDKTDINYLAENDHDHPYDKQRYNWPCFDLVVNKWFVDSVLFPCYATSEEAKSKTERKTEVLRYKEKEPKKTPKEKTWIKV